MSFLEWQFVITTRETHTLTFLNRLARNRDILFTLDAGSVAHCEVPSDSPEVNILHTDGDPFVAHNNRFLYGFRREAQVLGNYWVCRFAGVLMDVEDEAQADQPTTHITAYDPWQYLMSRPLVRPGPTAGGGGGGGGGGRYTCDTSGNGLFYWSANPGVPTYGGLQVTSRKDGTYDVNFNNGPGTDGSAAGSTSTYMASDYVDPDCGGGSGSAGNYQLVVNQLSYTTKSGSAIAVELLKNTTNAHGSCYIDFGQSSNYQGIIEDTGAIPGGIDFTQGISVGEAWTQLCDTGTLDIVLKPIYDPENRPGYLAELSIYKRSPTTRLGVGQPRYSAIFAWDMPSRSLVGVNHLLEGSQMANRAQFYTSSGLAAAFEEVPTSVAKYGQFWLQKSVTDVAGPRLVGLLAQADLQLRKRGKETLTIDPVPERSPVPFIEYGLGDVVPVYASKRLRLPITSDMANPGRYPNWRVYAIPVTIRDDGIETVQRLLLSDPGIQI